MTRHSPWKLLTYESLSEDCRPLGELGPEEQPIVLIHRPDGSCIFGTVTDINRLAFEVVNGQIREVIPFTRQLVMYQLIERPSPRVWSRGQSQLDLI